MKPYRTKSQNHVFKCKFYQPWLRTSTLLLCPWQKEKELNDKRHSFLFCISFLNTSQASSEILSLWPNWRHLAHCISLHFPFICSATISAPPGKKKKSSLTARLTLTKNTNLQSVLLHSSSRQSTYMCQPFCMYVWTFFPVILILSKASCFSTSFPEHTPTKERRRKADKIIVVSSLMGRW